MPAEESFKQTTEVFLLAPYHTYTREQKHSPFFALGYNHHERKGTKMKKRIIAMFLAALALMSSGIMNAQKTSADEGKRSKKLVGESGWIQASRL